MSLLASQLAALLGGEDDATIDTPASDAAVVDHVTVGLDRLPSQWANAVNMRAMLAVFLQRFNDLETAYQDLLTKRSLNSANSDAPGSLTGAQLDRLGRIVGQTRNGLTNEDYRRYIAARIATNNSDGRFEDLIKIAGLILNNPDSYRIEVRQQTTDTVVVTIHNDEATRSVVDATTAGILLEFLRLAVKANARLLLITSPAVPGETFAFAGGTGAGFGSVFASGGGHFATVME